MGKGNPNYHDVLLNFFPRFRLGSQTFVRTEILGFRNRFSGVALMVSEEKRKTENRFNFSVHRISQVFPPFSSNSEFGRRYFLLLDPPTAFPRKKTSCNSIINIWTGKYREMGSDLILRKVRSRSQQISKEFFSLPSFSQSRRRAQNIR